MAYYHLVAYMVAVIFLADSFANPLSGTLGSPSGAKRTSKGRDGVLHSLRAFDIDAAWHTNLRYLPYSVNTLGRLIALSSDKDFNLLPAEKRNRTFLIHTGFRPSMVQVANEIWRAYRRTTREMKRFVVKIGKLPEAVKQIVEILLRHDVATVSHNLQTPQRQIKAIVNGCVETARNVEQRFVKSIVSLDETKLRVTAKAADALAVSESQVTNEAHEDSIGGQFSSAFSALNSIKNLRNDLNHLTKFSRILSGGSKVGLQRSFELLREILMEATLDPMSLRMSNSFNDYLITAASLLINVSKFLQTIAEVYVDLLEHYILTNKHLRQLPALQDAPKHRSRLIVQRLENNSKSTLAELERLANDKRRIYKQDTDKYNRQLRAIEPVMPDDANATKTNVTGSAKPVCLIDC